MSSALHFWRSQIPSQTLLRYPALSDKFRHLLDMKGIVSESHFSTYPPATTSRQWEPFVDPLDLHNLPFLSRSCEHIYDEEPSRCSPTQAEWQKPNCFLDGGLTGNWTIHWEFPDLRTSLDCHGTRGNFELEQQSGW